MVAKLFVVEFAATSSEAAVSKAFMCMFARYLNVVKWGLPSRALTGSYKQCSTFTNQFSSLRDSLFG